MSAKIDLNTSPLVSIAIPTLNRLDYLKEAAASALAQTYKQIEVLIGDDGQAETIQEWGQALARRDSRVRYQRNAYNLGLAGNWNALADSACGEFLIIIGDDDRLLPDCVERLIHFIEPSAHVAFSNHYLIDNQGIRLEVESQQLTAHYHRHELSVGEVVNPNACVWRNSIPISATLMRTGDVRRLRFKEDLNTPEIELFARLAQEGGRFFFTPEYLCEYRIHSESATAAGLRSENLVKYLAPIPVPPDVEPHKEKFMAGILVNAVSRCLQQGNKEAARQLLNHEYYPRSRWMRTKAPIHNRGSEQQLRIANQDQYAQENLKKNTFIYWTQSLCASLPTFLGCSAYRLLQSTKRRMR